MLSEKNLCRAFLKRGLVALIALTGISACEEAPSPPKAVSSTPVTLYNVQHSDETIAKFPGQVEASEYSNLSFRIGGKLQELNVKAGEEVQENQLIARLDDRDARAQLATAQSQFDVSSAMFERMEASVEKGAVSRSTFDEAKANFLAAKASLTNAQDQLSYTELRAPFAGLIASVPVENYQVIVPQQTIAELHMPGAIDVTFQLPEQKMRMIDRSRARENRSSEIAWVTFSGVPEKRYAAMYKDHESTTRQGELSYEVTITLPEPDDINVLAGMSATVLLDMSKLIESDAKLWLVPFGAVVTDNNDPNKAIVWRFKPNSQSAENGYNNSKKGTVEAVEVMITRGISNGLLVEGPLNDDDRIVAAGAHLVKEGQAVTEWTKEGGL
ncbi:efflux RND transporter periplasmic adaptor subunit [Alteromonas gracilis]|uniref:efflux RND transporter periplasmic adaptor subunit n=1 Tax=Alteromonas gracilis TaxID=1479524 RepID=UPI0037352F7C